MDNARPRITVTINTDEKFPILPPLEERPGALVTLKQEPRNPGTRGKWWCRSHRRDATHTDGNGRPCCNPDLGGILLPCHAVETLDFAGPDGRNPYLEKYYNTKGRDSGD